MKLIKYSIILIAIFLSNQAISQRSKTDANIVGHVQCNGNHVPYINISLEGTTIGTTTDETGHFQLINIPVSAYTITASGIGYKAKSHKIITELNKTIEVKFIVDEDILKLEEVVVSADRSKQKRTEAPIIINTISPKLFNTSQSVTIGEALNFSPGLRLENNCQNCGFSQIRMNGMEGPYSQILINSRPVFSGLAGVYGLELIPANMIEKIEVVRGGGSALYGSNAIAGTVNIIMKNPKTNSFEAGATYGLTGFGTDGNTASDYTISFNSSIVSDDNNSGISLYGFNRKREMYDANKDDFSEIAPLKNINFGAKAYHKFGYRDKLSVDFFAINEQRDGGSDQDYPNYQRRIGEVLTHNLNVAALTYDRYFRDYDMLSLFASGQFLYRDSYYGANFSTSDYGNTKDKTYNFGIQYKFVFEGSSFIAGIENTSGFLIDTKIGSPIYGINDDGEIIIIANNPNTTVANQSSITNGIFAQYDIKINRFKASLGARLDNYTITDREKNEEFKAGDKINSVFNPRISLMYELIEDLQSRLTYSQGYRAPQIFDEDLHIETSGLRQVIHVNDPDLKQETSHSLMLSFDYNKLIGTVYTGLLIEGFYTNLVDAFANKIGEPDEDDIVTYKRINSTGATVQGFNLELRLKPLQNFEFTSGFTLQTSKYEEEQNWGDKSFLRTPNQYGFFAFDWDFHKGFCFSTSANFTGSMNILYEGVEEKSGIDENGLVESDEFFDLGVKLSYSIKFKGTSVRFISGVKNIFNAYQSDFDLGIERDPAYIYGPLSPRTVYFGIKFGNLL